MRPIQSTLTLRSTAGDLNKACCCNSCNKFISDDEFELVGLGGVRVGVLLLVLLIWLWLLLLLLLKLLLLIMLLLWLLLLLWLWLLLFMWLVRFAVVLFIMEFDVWSSVCDDGFRWCWLLLEFIVNSSVWGRFVNTGEFGAEWCWYMLAVVPGIIIDDTLPPRVCNVPFGGVRSLNFVFRSLYAVFTPRLLCFTCSTHTKIEKKRTNKLDGLQILLDIDRWTILIQIEIKWNTKKSSTDVGNERDKWRQWSHT